MPAFLRLSLDDTKTILVSCACRQTNRGNQMIITRKRTDHKTSRMEFGVFDEKGREIGAAYTTHTLTLERDESDLTYGFSAREEDLGVWYVGYFHVTKDRKAFGATHRDTKFRTQAERDTWAAKEWLKRLNAAKKKYRAV